MLRKKPLIQTSPGRRNVLSLSMGAAIALLATAEAHASCLAIATTQPVSAATGCVNWSAGNLSLNSGGALTSTNTAVLTASAVAGTLTNDGTIYGTLATGLLNNATGLTVINNKLIYGDISGIDNTATILSLTNNSGGTISSSAIGIINSSSGQINTLNNNGGTISGTVTGISNIGSISTLTNQSGGLITATGSSGTIVAVDNSGTINAFTNSGTISSNLFGIHNTGSITALTNSSTGTITTTGSGGSINRAVIFNDGGTIATLTNSGLLTGLSNYGVDNSGIINVFNNTITGSIVGTIHGGEAGVVNSGTITSFNNSAVITGDFDGLLNNGGLISTLNNSGTIDGGTNGINNQGTITNLFNTGTIKDSFSAGLLNSVSIATLTNNGLISGANGIANTGVLNTLSNSGTIIGTSSFTNAAAINNSGTIGTIANTGLITGYNGISSYGTLGPINNSGTIIGSGSSGFAIYNDASSSIGVITNSGLIAGNIKNLSSTGLTINGSSGSGFGTLTGASAGIGSADMGLITNTASNLYFSSGNLLLNDSINVGSNTVSNTGAVLQVNNHVSITGNYAQGASAALLIGVGNSAVSNGVAADTGYGRLIVSGAAVIDSGSSVSLKATNSYAFAAGQRYVVVQAATSGTNYNASSLVYTAIGYSGAVTGSVVIDGSNSDLLLTLGSGTNSSSTGSTGSTFATTPNAVAAISGLFNYSGVNLGLTNVFNASKALGSTTEANRAGAQLSPTSNAVAATQASSAPTQTVLNVAGAHVDGLRIAQADGSSGVATGERGNNFATWGQIFGGKANQSQRDNISGYSANYNGLLIGGDTLLNDAWRVGGLFSYTNTSVSSRDDNAGSSVGLKSYGLIGYAGYTADSWYLDLSGGVVQHKYNTTRLINFTGFNGVANGSYNGTQSVLSAEGGYPIRLDATTVLTPVAGLNYSKLRQNGYTESGGNGAALTVAGNKSSSFKSDLGAKLERSFVTSYGSLAPSVQLTWRHEYQNTRLRSVASYAADTSGATSFVSYGASPIANSGIMALAATLTRSDNITLTARYTMEAASGYMSQTADLRLRYQF